MSITQIQSCAVLGKSLTINESVISLESCFQLLSSKSLNTRDMNSDPRGR